MLYRIGTQVEVKTIIHCFPHQLTEEVSRDIIALDNAYGEERDYTEQGGYSLIAETVDDLLQVKKIVDYTMHPCERASKVMGTEYISALYILNDDFSVTLYLPLILVPSGILENLED